MEKKHSIFQRKERNVNIESTEFELAHRDEINSGRRSKNNILMRLFRMYLR